MRPQRVRLRPPAMDVQSDIPEASYLSHTTPLVSTGHRFAVLRGVTQIDDGINHQLECLASQMPAEGCDPRSQHGMVETQ